MDLTDKQWAVVEPLLPELRRREDGRGRPWAEPRGILNGILWILRTGAPWSDLPRRYASSSTAHRRFQEWAADGTWLRIVRALARDLEERGGLKLDEAFIDGTYAGAKKGVYALHALAADWPPRSWQLQTAMAFLLASQSLKELGEKLPSSTKPSPPVSARSDPSASSATRRTTARSSTKRSKPKRSSSSRR